MKRVLAVLALSALLVAAVIIPARAGGDHWPLDRAHSRVTFTVTKWGFAEVEGRFRDFDGAIAYDPAKPEASHVEWRVRIASVDTGEGARDHTLQAPEYFDTARYPEMRFVSTSTRLAGPEALDVAGTLTIKGVSKPFTVRVTHKGRHAVPGEGVFEMFETRFSLNRYDFGVVGGSLLGPAISKDVNVFLIGAAKQPAMARH